MIFADIYCFILKQRLLKRRETEVSFCFYIFVVLLRKIVSLVYGLAESKVLSLG